MVEQPPKIYTCINILVRKSWDSQKWKFIGILLEKMWYSNPDGHTVGIEATQKYK